jgi:PPK2 family polyphosphate:nucleotide phosphotransferase
MSYSALIAPGSKVKLSKYDPNYHGKYTKGSPEVPKKLATDLGQMCQLQEKLYAEGRQGLLIVLQGMDGAGKDGTISHVMSGLNPQACDVTPFKVPTPEELAHDFLWRIHKWTPARGHIMIFNRSHYEDVLAPRVHGLVPPAVWRKRYAQINDFEAMLAANGTRILKFFLHISNEEQKRRLEARVDDPTKQWKISPEDLPERKFWDQYQAAYEDLLTRCSTKVAPWHLIPSNYKWYRNLAVAGIVAATLREMHPKWPPPQVDLSQVKIT